MKILKLLNKIFLYKIIFLFSLSTNSFSNEPVDIWSINNNTNEKVNVEDKKSDQSNQNSYFKYTN